MSIAVGGFVDVPIAISPVTRPPMAETPATTPIQTTDQWAGC
ncbi:MAG TPA: hypothetical protein VFG33_00670 [Kribbella sp.]|nr:hypothetical protein [Kribbella sp.]HET6291843.1 hypothetical protein [Kribbella sp.]